MNDIKSRADFSFVRYANCWEDADILLQALNVRPGKRYISIASGGDNSFSICSMGGNVTAIDLSLPQLAVIALKRAAYKLLDYDGFLRFIGVRPCSDRSETYAGLKRIIEPVYSDYLDRLPEQIAAGIIHCGKFENYFQLFRSRIIPLIHSKKTLERMVRGDDAIENRIDFYEKKWDNLRWNILFDIFFSKRVMGKKGRDREFFKYVDGSVSKRIKERVKHGVTYLNPAENPYFQYIMKGNFDDRLPHALREENFLKIKQNIDNITLMLSPLEDYLDTVGEEVAGYNLSDIFEYMDRAQMDELYAKIVKTSEPGARIVYWNMLVSRSFNPQLFDGKVRPLTSLSQELFKNDKAFFYSKFIVEEKI